MDSIAQPASETIDFAALFEALPNAAPATQTPATQLPAVSVAMGGQTVRLVAFSGTGGWHTHATASETVIVWSGTFDVEYRDRVLRLGAGQCTVIAPGDEHRGVSDAGAQVVLVRAAG